jgi:2-C-methyl-D-erythritol 4-phosphate cytidylyltransferase
MEPVGAFAIVVAAGSGSRVGAGEPKAFLTIGGRPMILLAVEAALSSPAIKGVVVVAPPGHIARAHSLLASVRPTPIVVAGGATRQDSVRSGLRLVPDHVDVVVVHDAARPFAPERAFDEVVQAVLEGADAAVPVLLADDTVKRVRDGVVIGTEPRDEIALAQTPQAFRTELLRDAHERAAVAGWEVTDDATLLERTGAVVRALPGDPRNFKITTALDLDRADRTLAERHG